MKIQDYTIVSEEESDQIESKINCMRAEGWEPVGSICRTIVPDRNAQSELLYSQAMVLYSN